MGPKGAGKTSECVKRVLSHACSEALFAERNNSSIKLKTHIAGRKRFKIAVYNFC